MATLSSQRSSVVIVPLVPINPNEIAPPSARYEHAVMAENSSRILHTSGIVPVKSDGTVPDGIRQQAEVIWLNIRSILKEASMDNGLLFVDLSQPINNEESKKIEITDKNNKIKDKLISLGSDK